jgi:small conductance mechanosensitive channel
MQTKPPHSHEVNPTMPIALSDGALEWLRTSGIRIAAVIVVAVIVSRIGTLAVRRLRKRIEGDPRATGEISLQRTTSVVQTLATALKAAVWTVAVLLVLGQVGLDIGPLIAGAGVLGVALGFGAQSLVRDFLNGFFVLFENQYAVGDQVELATTGGTVLGRIEQMSLRSTGIRADDGTLHTVPNGNIQLVANRSRGIGVLDIEVRVPSGRDVGTVAERLEELFHQVQEDGSIARLAGPPKVEGVEPEGPDTAIVRVTAPVRPSRRDEVERELRRRIATRFGSIPQDVVLGGR